MSFQVILCANSVALIPIAVSLREDVVSPCMVSLDLIANVTGDFRGHTFLWELHSGTQVVFTTPTDQLTATCTLLDSTDKIFYFWVDKGSSGEQHYVFRYYGTATERTPMYSGNTLITSGLYIDNGTPSCDSIYGMQALFGINTSGEYQINPSNPILRWNLPLNLSNLYQIHVEQNVNGGWVNVLSLSPLDPQILYNATNNTYYRIKTDYLIDHQYYSQYSCTYYLLLDIVDYNMYIDEILYGANNTLTITNITNYQLLSSDGITNELVENTPLYGSNTIQNINMTTFSLAEPSIILEDSPAYGSNYLNLTSVVYLDGVVIGG